MRGGTIMSINLWIITTIVLFYMFIIINPAYFIWAADEIHLSPIACSQNGGQ